MKGRIDKKTLDRLVLEAGGVGYEILAPLSTIERLPEAGQETKLHIIESAGGMYGGVNTLYGFLTEEELDVFVCMKENLPNTGAKKALEYLDKAAKSFPDFRRAVLEQDAQILASIFGFTAKTAAKLIAGLKDRLASLPLSGPEKWSGSDRTPSGVYDQALKALIALGYKEGEARETVSTLNKELSASGAKVEDVIRRALNLLAR